MTLAEKKSSKPSPSAGRSAEQNSDQSESTTSNTASPQPTILDQVTAPVQITVGGAATYALAGPVLELIKKTVEANQEKCKEHVQKALQQPYVRNGLLAAAGAAVAYKVLPGQIASLQQWRTQQHACSMRIAKDSHLYEPFMTFFSQQNDIQRRSRHVTVRTNKDRKKEQVYDLSSNASGRSDSPSLIHEVHYPWNETFTYEAKSFWCTKEDDEAVKVWQMSNNKADIDSMLRRLYEADQEKKYSSHIEVYYPKIGDCGAYWAEHKSARSRCLKSVCLEPSMKQKFVRDLDAYFHESAADWYAERGFPQRRGYLLHGPPGTGKTSLVKAVCGQYGLKMYVLSLSVPGMTDKILLDLFEELGPRDLVLLEDIDAAGAPVESRGATEEVYSYGKEASWDSESSDTDNFSDDADLENEEGEEKDQGWDETWSSPGWDTSPSSSSSRNSKAQDKGKGKKKAQMGVTLSGLLNALDGPNSPEGHVVFMTSNHPEKLDPALVRRGRIDQQIKLDYASRAQLQGLFEMFYAPSKTGSDSFYSLEAIPSLAKIFADVVPEKVLTPAQVLGHFFDHRNEPEEAVRGIHTWLAGEGFKANMTTIPELLSSTSIPDSQPPSADYSPIPETESVEEASFDVQDSLAAVPAKQSIAGWFDSLFMGAADAEVHQFF